MLARDAFVLRHDRQAQHEGAPAKVEAPGIRHFANVEELER